jgi:hypothetical protein
VEKEVATLHGALAGLSEAKEKLEAQKTVLMQRVRPAACVGLAAP